jgi:hypothetical protein
MTNSRAPRSWEARHPQVNGFSLDLSVLEGKLIELFGARRRFSPALRDSFGPRRDLTTLASVLFGARGCEPTVIRQVREPSRNPAASNGSSESDGVLTVSIELD